MSRLTRRAVLAATAGLAGCTTSFAPARTDAPERVTPDDDATDWAVRMDRPVIREPAASGDRVYVVSGEVTIQEDPDGDVGDGGAAAITAGGDVEWSADLPAPPTDDPMAHDGGFVVPVGGSNGYTGREQRLLGVGDGAVRWEGERIGQFLELLAVDGDQAYLGTSDDALGPEGQPLLAVDLSDGETGWRTGSGDATGGWLLERGLLVDVAHVMTGLYDPDDGGEKWVAEAELLRSADGSLPSLDGAVFASVSRDEGEAFAAVDLSDGEERWRFEGAGEAPYVYSGAATLDGSVVGAEYDGALFALDPATGEERWRFGTDGDTHTSPVAAGGSLYVGDGAGVVFALDGAGERRWRTELGGPVSRLYAGEDLVLASPHRGDGSRLVGLDPADGSTVWSFESGESLTRPVLAGRRAYVGSKSGLVRALGP